MTDHEDALERRRRSHRTLVDQGLPVIEELPCLVPISRVRLRSQEDVVVRAACIACVHYRSELQFLEDLDDFMRDEDLFRQLTPTEKEFYFSPDVREHQEFAEFTWRLESCHVLFWALGHFDRLEHPEVPFGSEAVFHHFFAGGLPFFRDSSRLRPVSAILDAADLYFRYYELVRRAFATGTDVPRGLILEIVRERFAALSWILGKGEWDEIQKNT